MRKNLIIASLIALAIILWLLSGLLFRGDETTEHPALADASPAVAADTTQNLTRVRVRELLSEHHTRVVVLRGRSESKRAVDVKAEVAGMVVARPVERGMQVMAGDLLCELAVDDRAVSVSQAKASLKEAEIEYQGSLKLKQQGLQSNTAIARTAARLSAAKAELHRKNLNLDRTKMLAPFNGFVDRLQMNVGDYATPGAVCATLIDLDPMLISANVTEAEVESMTLNNTVTGHTSTGVEVSGTLTFIGRQSDPSTRTYPVEITVANPDFQLRSGLTTNLRIELDDITAHRLSPALFALNDKGELGVRTVSAFNYVEFHRISIIEDTEAGAWVTGLPEKTNLITVGQEFVHAGQLVEPFYLQHEAPAQ